MKKVNEILSKVLECIQLHTKQKRKKTTIIKILYIEKREREIKSEFPKGKQKKNNFT